MPPIPFSDVAGGGADNLAELGDVEVDATTLANGHELVYDSVDEKWKNAAGAGGALFAGTTGDFLYKDGAVARTGGISNDPSSAGKALVVDPAALRVGIGGKTSPPLAGRRRLDGVADTHTVTIADDTLGVTTSAPLRLFLAQRVRRRRRPRRPRLERQDAHRRRHRARARPGRLRRAQRHRLHRPVRFKLQSGTYNQAQASSPSSSHRRPASASHRGLCTRTSTTCPSTPPA